MLPGVFNFSLRVSQSLTLVSLRYYYRKFFLLPLTLSSLHHRRCSIFSVPLPKTGPHRSFLVLPIELKSGPVGYTLKLRDLGILPFRRDKFDSLNIINQCLHCLLIMLGNVSLLHVVHIVRLRN